MAEVFGAVASGAGLVSLAIQLGESAVKLKRFYDEVERAPRRLQSLAREIDLFSNILRNLENVRLMHGVSDSDILAQCIEMCEDSTRDIVAATTKIDKMQQRSRLTGRLYAAVKMPEVIALCNDMERSKNSLSMAFQMFHGGLLSTILTANQTMSAQVASLAAAFLTAPPQPVASTPLLAMSSQPLTDHHFVDQDPIMTVAQADQAQYQSKTSAMAKKRRSHKTVFRCRIPSPSWFKQVVWDISVLHSEGWWSICLQTENLVPRWSSVFFHAEQGDVLAVKQLFQEGKASPYDFFLGPFGRYTLIEAAARSRSAHMIKFLLDLVHPEARGSAATLSYIRLLSGKSWRMLPPTLRKRDDRALAKAASYLLESQPIHIVDGLVDRMHESDLDIADPVVLPHLRKILRENRYEWNAQDWLKLFMKSSYYKARMGWYMNIGQFGIVDGDFAALSKLRDPLDKYDSVLHCVAAHFGMTAKSPGRDGDGWAQLLIGLLSANLDSRSLHMIDSSRQTPFLRFLQRGKVHSDFDGAQGLVSIWSETLRVAGLNVDHFFTVESASWKTMKCPIAFSLHGKIYMRLKGLYKKSPTSEWGLLTDYYDEVETWELQSLPGSWPSRRSPPRTILWCPRQWTMEDEEGSWRYAGSHEVLLNDCPWLHDIVYNDEEDRKGRARNAVHHDDGLIVEAANTHKFASRRTASEPPTLPQAHRIRQQSVGGYLKYCWLHSTWCRQSLAQVMEWCVQHDKELRWQEPEVHGEILCFNPECCYRYRLLGSQREYLVVSQIAQQRKGFMGTHGAPPAICSQVVGPSPRGAQSRPDNLVSSALLFEFAVDLKSPSIMLCEAFPNCAHQEVHIERLRQEKEYQATR